MSNAFFGSSRYLAVGLLGFGHDLGPYGSDNDGVKTLQPVQQQADVMAGGDEEGIDGVIVGASQPVSPEFPVGLHMPDNGLDGAAASQFAFDGWRLDAPRPRCTRQALTKQPSCLWSVEGGFEEVREVLSGR